MSEIRLRGPLVSIYNDLERIQSVVSLRKTSGFDMFKPDEIWEYFPKWDTHLCPVCKAYGQKRYFRGDELPREFPKLELSPMFRSNYLIYPRVHQDAKHGHLKGKCRCMIILKNPAETLGRRLNQEMKRVAVNKV